MRRERRDRLQSALERLDPDHREVIVLARLKELRLERGGRAHGAFAECGGAPLDASVVAAQGGLWGHGESWFTVESL